MSKTKIINFNEEPINIEKYNKTPLSIIFGVIVIIVIFLLYSMSAKQKKVKSEQGKQDNVLMTTSMVMRNEEKKGTNWFDAPKFKKIVLQPISKSIKEPLQPILDNTPLQPLTDVQPKSMKNNEKEFQKQIKKEEYRVKFELAKMKQQRFLDAEQDRIQAITSISKINVQKSSNIPIKKSSQGESWNTMDSVPEDSLTNVSRIAEKLLKQYGGETEERDQNMQINKIQFLNEGVSEDEYLPYLKQSPLSLYELKAGSVIPASLITEINSDLPGTAIAQVRENVYDSVTGEYLLIPQGTRIIGPYDSQVSFGQNSLLTVWTRLQFPDGKTLNLEKMQGADLSGKAGFRDKVDYHYIRMYSNAILLSMVGAGYDVLNKDTQDNSTQDSVAASVGQQLAEISEGTMKKNLNLQPTIRIRPGYRFNIIVQKDMILENLNEF